MGDISNGITEYPILVLTFIVGATVLVLVYISSLLKSSKQEEKPKTSQSEMVQREKTGPPPPPTKSGKKKHEKWGRDSKQTFSHPWLLTSLKGHTGSVLDMDFSSNGKFLATCAEDRAVLLWSTKDWSQKEHKSTRINVEFDHATFVRWSPDSKAFIIHKAMENEVDVYKINKRADGWISGATKHLTFSKYHDTGIVGLGIACNGKFIMSCSEKTDLVLLDLKGQLLAKVDTYLMNTYRARVSPCGRFIAASGFAADVKIWEVVFTKSGEFSAVSRAFELTGHSAGVYDFAFNADSSCMATVSKDGTWKVFNTKIEFEKGEDPHLLVTGKYDSSNGKSAHIVLSPNGEVVTIAVGSMLLFYSVLSGELDAKIENVYSGPITCIQFDAGGKFLLTAGEKHVRVFHNVTGYRVSIVSTRAKLRKSGLSSAQKDRMEQQIKEAQEFLQALGEPFE